MAINKDIDLMSARKLAGLAYLIAAENAPYKEVKPKQEIVNEYEMILLDNQRIKSAYVQAALTIGMALLGGAFSKIAGKVSSKIAGKVVNEGVGKGFKGFVTKNALNWTTEMSKGGSKAVRYLSGATKDLPSTITKLGLKFATKAALKPLTKTLFTNIAVNVGMNKLEKNLDSLGEEQKTAVVELMDTFVENFEQQNLNALANNVTKNIVGTLATNLDPLTKRETIQVISTVMSTPRLEYIKVDAGDEDIKITLKDLGDFLDIKPSNNEQGVDKFTDLLFNSEYEDYGISARDINDIIWVITAFKNAARLNTMYTIRKAQRPKLDTISDVLNKTLVNTFNDDNLGKFINKFSEGKITEEEAQTGLAFIKELKNSNINININEDLTRAYSNEDSWETFIDTEPLLLYGWNIYGIDGIDSIKLSGVNVGDVPYIIRHCKSLNDRFIELTANLKLLPNDLADGAFGSKIEFASIRKYSEQYYKYYKDAKFNKLSDDTLMNFRYLFYCLNGVDFNPENFMEFLEEDWDDELEDQLFFLFDIVDVEGKGYCTIVPGNSPVPEPDQYNNDLLNKFFKLIQDMSKDTTEEEAEVMNLALNDIQSKYSLTDNSFDYNEAEGFKNYDILKSDYIPEGINNNLVSKYKQEYNKDFVAKGEYYPDFVKKYTIDFLKKYKTPYRLLKELSNELDKSMRDRWGDDFDEKLAKNISPTITFELPTKQDDSNNIITKKVVINIFEDIFKHGRNTNEYGKRFNAGLKNSLNAYKTSNVKLFESMINYAQTMINLLCTSVFDPSLDFKNDGKVINSYIPDIDKKDIQGRNVYNSLDETNKPQAFYLFKQAYLLGTEIILLIESFYQHIIVTEEVIESEYLESPMIITKETTYQSTFTMLGLIQTIRKIMLYLGDFKQFSTLFTELLGKYYDEEAIQEKLSTLSHLENSFKATSILVCQSGINLLYDILGDGKDTGVSAKFKAICDQAELITAFDDWFGKCVSKESKEENLGKLNMLVSQACAFSDNGKSYLKNSSAETEYYETFIPTYYEVLTLLVVPAFAVTHANEIQEYVDGILLAGELAAAAIVIAFTAAGSAVPGIGTIVGALVGVLAMCVTMAYREFFTQPTVYTEYINVASSMSRNYKNMVETSMHMYGPEDVLQGNVMGIN